MGKTFKDFETQKWVSEQPKRWLIGTDKLGNEIYVGDTVSYFDDFCRQYRTLRIKPIYGVWFNGHNFNIYDLKGCILISH